MTSFRRYATWATASFASMVLNLRFMSIPLQSLPGHLWRNYPRCSQPRPAVTYRMKAALRCRPVHGSHRVVTAITRHVCGDKGLSVPEGAMQAPKTLAVCHNVGAEVL